MKTNGKASTGRKLGCVMLALFLAVSMLPMTAFADDNGSDPANQIILDESGDTVIDEDTGTAEQAADGSFYEETGPSEGAIQVDEDEDYEDARGWGDSVYVLGQRITNENCDDVLGDGGSVAYDHDTRTITLTDAMLDLADYQSEAEENNTVSAIDTYRNLNIVLKGQNAIISTALQYTDDKEYVYGITATDELTISGTGTLSIMLNTEKNTPAGSIKKYYGIDSWRKLTIDHSPVVVFMTGANGVTNCGISAGYRGFELKNGTSVYAAGGGSSSTALHDSSFGTSVVEAGSSLVLSSPYRAYSYTMLPPSIKALGALVNTEDSSAGTFVWDRVTGLDTYKYISIPEPAEEERGFGDNVYILGRLIDDSNCGDVLGDGTVKYDKASKTLTLTNAKLDLTKYTDPAAENNYVAGINAFNDLNIVLNGFNIIIGETSDYTDNKEYVYGITADGALNISGEGLLDIALNTENTGIEEYCGIDSGRKLTVNCKELDIVTEGAGCSNGISTNWDGITVKSGSTVWVSMDGSAGTALYDTSFGKSVVEEGASLELLSEYRAFQYTMLNNSLIAQGALVNGRPTSEGAFEWDGTTRLSVYKYVKFPSDGERGWGDSIYVLGTRVTEDNYTDVLGDGGSVKYDHETRTITLTNAVLDLANYQDPSPDNNTVTGIDAYRELNLVLVGNNTICSSVENAEGFAAQKEYVHGISATGELNISGDGTLDISIYTGLSADSGIDTFYGIDSWQQLTVDVPRLTVNMSGAGKSTAVDANWNGIYVKAGSEVILSAEGEKSRALYDRTFAKSVVEKGAVLELTADSTAFDYMKISDSLAEMVSLVNTVPTDQGAVKWDKTTRLDTYKYVRFETLKEPSTIVVANKDATYTGKAISAGRATVIGSTGKVTYKYYSDKACTRQIAKSKVVNVGTYYVIAAVAADDTYEAATSAPAYINITKATQEVKAVTPKTKTVKKTGGSFTLKATASLEQGTASFTKKSGSAKITVSKAGKVTVAKGLTSGKTYTLKVNARIAATANCKATKAKTFTIKITIK